MLMDLAFPGEIKLGRHIDKVEKDEDLGVQEINFFLPFQSCLQRKDCFCGVSGKPSPTRMSMSRTST